MKKQLIYALLALVLSIGNLTASKIDSGGGAICVIQGRTGTTTHYFPLEHYFPQGTESSPKLLTIIIQDQRQNIVYERITADHSVFIECLPPSSEYPTNPLNDWTRIL